MVDERWQSCLSKMALRPRPLMIAYAEHHVEHSAILYTCLFLCEDRSEEEERREAAADSNA